VSRHFREAQLHGTFGDICRPTAADPNEGWEPYIPWLLTRREVIRQLGYEPTLYVMRKRDGRNWLYRACTHSEISAIEISHA